MSRNSPASSVMCGKAQASGKPPIDTYSHYIPLDSTERLHEEGLLSKRKIGNTVARLKRAIRDSAEEDFRESQRRFSKEPIRSLGVRTADLRALARQAASEYRSAGLSIDSVLDIATDLWAGDYLEERVLGALILGRWHGQLERRHWPRLDDMVSTLSNWGETDALCVEVLARLLESEPALIGQLSAWTRGDSRWRRRAAAVSLVPLARRGKELEAVWELADRLAPDRDDMVEKALGWLLKEASRTRPAAVAEYLLERTDRLSRTTLRYGCEKLPADLRRRVLSG